MSNTPVKEYFYKEKIPWIAIFKALSGFDSTSCTPMWTKSGANMGLT